jgi:hypothetical protein
VELGYAHGHIAKIGFAQISSTEGSVIEVCLSEVDTPKDGIGKINALKLKITEIRVGKIRPLISVLLPPLIPRLHALFQNLQMLLVCHAPCSPISINSDLVTSYSLSMIWPSCQSRNADTAYLPALNRMFFQGVAILSRNRQGSYSFVAVEQSFPVKDGGSETQNPR